VVYAFTVSSIACKYGLPEYISFSLKQALITQTDADVILASNYMTCPKMKTDVETQLPGVQAMDTDYIRSARTAKFHNASSNIFQSEGWGELWVTSYGAIEEIYCNGSYVVDTGHIVGFDASLNYTIKAPGGGLVGMMGSGEGLVRSRWWLEDGGGLPVRRVIYTQRYASSHSTVCHIISCCLL
jgi:hypothetical protein